MVIAILTVVYFAFGLFRYKTTSIDLWLLIAWAIAVIVMITIIHRRNVMREQMLRCFYLSDEGIYNYEIGYAPLSRIEGAVEPIRFALFAADSLVEMSYGFEVADPPADFKPTMIIATEEFDFHRPDGEEEGSAIITKWKGSLLSVDSEKKKEGEVLGTFNNARELAFLLEDRGPFA